MNFLTIDFLKQFFIFVVSVLILGVDVHLSVL